MDIKLNPILEVTVDGEVTIYTSVLDIKDHDVLRVLHHFQKQKENPYTSMLLYCHIIMNKRNILIRIVNNEYVTLDGFYIKFD